jgi:capsular polysaccharide biosynthesis protein
MASESEQRGHPQYDEGEPVLTLREILRIIVSRLWVIVLVVVVFTGMAVGFSLTQTPTYEASVKVLVGQKQEEAAVSNLGSDVEGLQQLTMTITEAVDSRPVAEAVIDRLNLEMTPDGFLNNLEAQQIPETQFIQITYEDTNPERARLVANTTGEVLSNLVSEVSPDVYAVTASVWEPADTPEAPVSPNLKLNIFMALVVGVTSGLALAFLLEYLALGGKGIERDAEETEETSAWRPPTLQR